MERQKDIDFRKMEIKQVGKVHYARIDEHTTIEIVEGLDGYEYSEYTDGVCSWFAGFDTIRDAKDFANGRNK